MNTHIDITDFFPGTLICMPMNNPKITKVVFNDPATIIFWSNGEKTVVKCRDQEIFDPEKGLAMAIAKHTLGNNGNYYNEFKKWLPDNI